MRKFLILGLAVVLALGMMGGVFAVFQDTETSSGNTFTAGTLDLEIKDDNIWDPDPWGNGVDLTWVMDNMEPGVSEVTNYVTLRNVGSIRSDHVEIGFYNTINDAIDIDVDSDSNPDSLPQDMAKWLEIDQMQYGPINMKSRIKSVSGWDVNGNGWLDLDDVARSSSVIADSGPLDNLYSPEQVGGDISFHMTIKFNAGATSDIQGDTLTTIVTFTLNQTSSQ